MNGIYTLDIAHPPCTGDQAEQVLSESLRTVQSSSRYRILKIIHGYGSGGKGGVLKLTVKNWLYRNKGKFKIAIDGEDLNSLNTDIHKLCIECSIHASKEMLMPNSGITIVWVK